MLPKPKHLQPEYGAQFQDESVVAAYGHRPPYSPETFDLLERLVVPRYPSLLDVGCGPGPIARGMLGRVARIDALDWSEAMVAAGKQLPGGDDPSITWIVGRAEDAPLHPPYGLIVAGASLHWMDWSVVIPRLRDALAPDAVIAIVEDSGYPTPWHNPVGKVCAAFSTNRDYAPYNLIDELRQRNLFQVVGEAHTAPIPFTQTVDAYVESFHARNGFSRERMAPDAAATFDRTVHDLVAPYAVDGCITLQVFSAVTWGR